MAGLKAILVMSGCIMMCESKACTPEEQSAEAALYVGNNGKIDAYKASLTYDDIVSYGVCGEFQKSVCGGTLCNTKETTNLFLDGMPPEGCEICRSTAGEYVITTETINAMNVYNCDGLNFAETLEDGTPPPRPWYNVFGPDGRCGGGNIDPVACYASCGAVDPPLESCQSVKDEMYPGGCLSTCSVEEALPVVQSRFPECGFTAEEIGLILGQQPSICSASCEYIDEPETCADVEEQMYAGGCLSTCTAQEALLVAQYVQPGCQFTAEGIASLLGQPNPNPSGNDDDDDMGVSNSKKAMIGGIVGGAAAFVLIGGAVFMVMRNRADNYGAKKPGKDISDDRL